MNALATFPSTEVRPIRLLIVDDSQVVRSIFERILMRQANFIVSGTCSSVDEALRFLGRETVDIVLLDIEMPGRSGLDALPEILQRADGAAVIVVSSTVEQNSARMIEAVSLGACDTLAKPGGAGVGGHFAENLVAKIESIAAQRASGLAPSPARQGGEPCSPDRGARAPISRPGCIAIGASTGGIVGIQQFLSALPATIDCPILITQHLPRTFIPYFAGQLAGRVSRNVQVCTPGTSLVKNHIYLAPGDGHLGCTRQGSAVVATRVEGDFAAHYAPAVDPMLSAAAQTYGEAAVAIVLSGMGIDGLEGAREVRRRGGTVIVQDEDSSVVWGMPGHIAKSGLADAIMRPADMGPYIYERSAAA